MTLASRDDVDLMIAGGAEESECDEAAAMVALSRTPQVASFSILVSGGDGLLRSRRPRKGV